MGGGEVVRQAAHHPVLSPQLEVGRVIAVDKPVAVGEAVGGRGEAGEGVAGAVEGRGEAGEGVGGAVEGRGEAGEGVGVGEEMALGVGNNKAGVSEEVDAKGRVRRRVGVEVGEGGRGVGEEVGVKVEAEAGMELNVSDRSPGVSFGEAYDAKQVLIEPAGFPFLDALEPMTPSLLLAQPTPFDGAGDLASVSPGSNPLDSPSIASLCSSLVRLGGQGSNEWLRKVVDG